MYVYTHTHKKEKKELCQLSGSYAKEKGDLSLFTEKKAVTGAPGHRGCSNWHERYITNRIAEKVIQHNN